MNKNEKIESIAEAKELIQNATALYLTDYSKINVADISGLRNQFRKDGVTYKIFKNTLFKRALVESGKFEKLADHLEGMTGFAFASTNPVAPAKIIKKYNDTSQKFQLKACYIETQYFDGNKLAQLAELPTKDELVAGIMGSLNSPAAGIVGSITAVIRNLVSVIDEVSKKKAA
ncbi:MAG: 50S ribosomal protein L10 [Ignavibacteriaceae bacterium]|nr:50S ribosomal protein L10 [Ignavibacteriaceae bacterium]HMN26120.1 50S ribosomal protein L10 [Ignavibacteriaceae bacterium]HRN25348.1 50S ribosomal protein L10 [Ignavibacteriaceae bacterium]HRQ52990.1 50S ribosomal protein L10 [Ignavibacteriaceae bacterium]